MLNNNTKSRPGPGKHTPAPWRDDGLYIKAECNGTLIAKIDPPSRVFRGAERREEMEYCRGNARVIAAAPDLLEAHLKEQEWRDREAAGALDPEWDYETMVGQYRRAAIAKATGEATC